jgi:hypothetical protein
MNEYPRPIEGGNSGDGSPLVLGDKNAIGDLFCPSNTLRIVDWDGDGERELVCSGGTGDIYSFKFVDAIMDGTPIVDRGLRWGELARNNHRNDNDSGLTGSVAVSADLDGDGKQEIVLCPRGYSLKSTVVIRLGGGIPPSREGGCEIVIRGVDGLPSIWGRGMIAAVDWNGDGRIDLVALGLEYEGRYGVDPATGVAAEDQRERYRRDGSWIGGFPGRPVLHLLRNTTANGRFEFTCAGRIDIDLPPHGMHICEVDPTDPKAGLLLLNYYGHIHHLPLLNASDAPAWGEAVEIFTLHNEPFNHLTNFESSIIVSDVLEPGRFDMFAGDKSGNVCWCRRCGCDADGRPRYAAPRKLKQRNPHVNGGFFSVPTLGDWRGTGTPDLLVGTLEGYVLWYRTLSTKPLRFAPPQRVRYGTTQIRRLATPNPAAGRHWGGSQGPYDGDAGGYSNPVLADWSGNGLLDLIVSDMVSLYEWYPNRGSKTQPELGPPQCLHLTDGEPLFGAWRTQPGIGDFTGDGLPDIVIQDQDLDVALHRRAGRDDPAALRAGEKLRYEDGDTIKTHGIYTPGGGDPRGRTKINVVDWNGDGRLDLLIGVGPQHGSPWRGSFVLFAANVGSNERPVFRRPDILLWDIDGRPLEFWRHGVHMAPVDWDADGRYELVAGADSGYIWYWNHAHFGAPANGDPAAPMPRVGEDGFGPRAD